MRQQANTNEDIPAIGEQHEQYEPERYNVSELCHRRLCSEQDISDFVSQWGDYTWRSCHIQNKCACQCIQRNRSLFSLF